MQSNAQAGALIRDLADKLQKRLQNGSGLNSIRKASDAQGWPMLFLSRAGNEAEGQPVALVRIRNIDMVSKDVFGNQTYAYAPHQLELAYEQGIVTAAAGPNPPDIDVARADLYTIMFEAIRTGVQMQIKEVATGTAVTEAALNSTSPLVSLDSLFSPNKGV